MGNSQLEGSFGKGAKPYQRWAIWVTTVAAMAITALLLSALWFDKTDDRPLRTAAGQDETEGSLRMVETIPIVADRGFGINRVYVAFVEFDRSGQLLIPTSGATNQVAEAKRRLRQELDEKPSIPLLLVGYVHGWKHGANSGDVIQFKRFVQHLGEIGAGRPEGQRFRVMGVYFAWPGAPFGPLKTMSCRHAQAVGWTRPLAPFLVLAEQLSVWNRWKVALAVGTRSEDSQGPGLAEVIGELAAMVRSKNDASRSVVIGHSMGGLILEKALIEPWAFGRAADDEDKIPDLVFTMNAAAPAILATREIDALAARPFLGRPRFISITSTSDSATRFIAVPALMLGQSLGWMGLASERRVQREERDLVTRTTGHIETLRTHEFKKEGCANWSRPCEHRGWLLSRNLFGTGDEVFAYLPSPKRKCGEADCSCNNCGTGGRCTVGKWRMGLSERRGASDDCPYWIVWVGRDLIADHGDIWDTQAVSVMAAAFRRTGLLAPQRAEGK